MTKERLQEHIREALAEVEEQRDDAVVYLSTIKVLLDVLARGHAAPACGQEIAEALVQQLAVEGCALVLAEQRDGDLALAGVAGREIDESCWLALARLLRPGATGASFRCPPAGFGRV